MLSVLLTFDEHGVFCVTKGADGVGKEQERVAFFASRHDPNSAIGTEILPNGCQNRPL